ncbi:PREDICTED: uncharacterized protein LOC104605415 [Nelumbo nucifera]|uniref:Uncharacterized protein LOC104605415 n=2 Tax=Nelumbo nucifera TaxID=4432 RepID=A0A1U8AZB5_NELNU|nr:PREDICTED: uncharacterized protein LOC104605415 [Nelumbo nucifera]DAD41175.1 TPA_asm: hypothetical protein HUJ06_015498 [Nelumbo nucifera]
MNDLPDRMDDPFIRNYQTSELQIAAEFLTTWLPFLTRDLCPNCTHILSDRVRSIDPELSADPEHSHSDENLANSNPTQPELHEKSHDNHDDCDNHSLGSWKDGDNGWSEHIEDVSSNGTPSEPAIITTPTARMSWADMAQEDELEEEEGEDVEKEGNKHSSGTESLPPEKVELGSNVQRKPSLSRERREYLRFMNVQRKKDFICLERINGKIVNILDGLELHTGVFSAAEQKRIVNFVYVLQEKGKKGDLRERTYTAPLKWMRGKGRMTIQFGCCYNYAIDKNGNPPGILRDVAVDPIPHLFKVIIRRLVGWHIIPPSCVPDSCIVNIYEEGDCIPPHIDNHDFVRPFCTVSFLSECNIMFGSSLKVVSPGEFSGPIAIPLPVGSVLVLNGNGADIAKHCVPAVPTKRISITFRKMDESKRPFDFVPEPDLQGIQPLPYDLDESKKLNPSKPQSQMKRQSFVREGFSDKEKAFDGRGTASEPRHPRNRSQPTNRRRVRVSLGN